MKGACYRIGRQLTEAEHCHVLRFVARMCPSASTTPKETTSAVRRNLFFWPDIFGLCPWKIGGIRIMEALYTSMCSLHTSHVHVGFLPDMFSTDAGMEGHVYRP